MATLASSALPSHALAISGGQPLRRGHVKADPRKVHVHFADRGVFVPDEAQHILDLLMRHANDIAVTLTQFPQYYEPLFLARDHKGRTVSIVDEWCCGYVKGIALDPSGWQPLFEAHPDWFEAIHLYGTESGWDRLKELVEAYQDADARHQAFVELIAPAARNIHAYWLARRAPARDTIDDTRRPIHKVLVPGRNDPCLCGSGKKFKHCHGALKLLR